MTKIGNHSRLSRVFFGLLCLVFVIVVAVYLALRFAPLPVAVADSAFPFERQIVKIPLRARIGRDLQLAPFGASEEVFESGARIYREQCAECHGTPGHDSPYVGHMYPSPPQLWRKNGTRGTVGVSDFEPGLAYWFVANGVRLSGMPSFSHTLSETEMWQVSLLLKNADKEMSARVVETLHAPQP